MEEPIMFARDLDGTGSLHPCSKEDPGAIPLYTESGIWSWDMKCAAMKDAGEVVKLTDLTTELADALAWYVENDDTNLSEDENGFFVDGYKKAKAVLKKLGR